MAVVGRKRDDRDHACRNRTSCCLFLAEIGYVEIVRHIPADDLEGYAMGSLPLEVGRVEEHLLICSECRERLKAADEYVAAMRMAAEKIRRDEQAG